MSQNYYPCPCCGFLTIGEEPPGTFEICDVCGWEDDNVQFNDPEYSGGANGLSLNQARENFKSFGACSQEKKQYARPPESDEVPAKTHKD